MQVWNGKYPYTAEKMKKKIDKMQDLQTSGDALCSLRTVCTFAPNILDQLMTICAGHLSHPLHE
jgi:hypothetical protein